VVQSNLGLTQVLSDGTRLLQTLSSIMLVGS